MLLLSLSREKCKCEFAKLQIMILQNMEDIWHEETDYSSAERYGSYG